jgi:hypothetical protein
VVKVPRPPRSRRARATWWLRHPLIVAILFAALVVMVSSLDGTTAGVWSRLTGVNVDIATRRNEVYLYRPPTGGFVVIDTDTESMDRLIPLLQTEAHRVIHATTVLRVKHEGWGFPTRLTMWREFEVLPVRGKTPDGHLAFTDQDLEEARRAFMAWLTQGEAWDYWSFRLGERERAEEFLVANFGKNVGTVALALVALLAAAGMPRYVRVWWASRRLDKSRCAVCRYDLSGALMNGAAVRCPECGAQWGVLRSKGVVPRLVFLPPESSPSP